MMIHHLTFINATDYIRKPGNSISGCGESSPGDCKCVQIGTGEHGVQTVFVFRQSAVHRFLIAELTLDDPKCVLYLTAHRGLAALHYLLRLLFLCFYERKLEVWNEKKIGRLVTVRANADGVYKIREEVTDEDCGLNNSWSMLLPPHPFSVAFTSHSVSYILPVAQHLLEYATVSLFGLDYNPGFFLHGTTLIPWPE